jgi:hypothetical protein
MCFSQGHKIGVLSFIEPIESTMNQNVVNKEIGQPIKKDAKAYKESVIKSVLNPNKQEHNTGNCKQQKEDIISLKPS